MVPEPTHRIDEADIGSGEKPPGQRDTEKLIEQVPKQPPTPAEAGKQQPGKTEGNQGGAANPASRP
jgi:hypothetical protein